MTTQAKNTTIRFSPEELAWLEEEAKRQTRSTANLVRHIVQNFIKTRRAVDNDEHENNSHD